jgi:hypothetical protein
MWERTWSIVCIHTLSISFRSLTAKYKAALDIGWSVRAVAWDREVQVVVTC